MKRILTIIMLLSLGCPIIAGARVMEVTDRPSIRSIREAARQVTAWNPQMISIRDTSLDRTFEDVGSGVKMQYPSSWERQDLLQRTFPLTLVTIFLSPDERPAGIRQNVNLVTEDLPMDMTLSEYTEQGIRAEREYFRQYTLLESEDILLAGAYRAHRVLFAATSDIGDMAFEQIWMLRGKQAFVWTFADSAEAFDDHRETFERMMDTLTVQ